MTRETTPMSGRVYGYVMPGENGKAILRMSRVPLEHDGAMAVLIVRGMIPAGKTVDLDIVSDPSLDPDLEGPVGPNGWTTLFAGEQDGTRTLLRVIDWVGGRGDKPALGYVGSAGAAGLVPKADGFNFNAIKRVDVFSGLTAANGVATIAFAPPFAAVPAKALPIGVPNLLAGPVKAEVVAGSLTSTGCQVRVTTAALLTGVITALAGATVNLIVIEA